MKPRLHFAPTARVARALLAIALTACAGSAGRAPSMTAAPPQTEPAIARATSGQLQRFAALRVIVLPLQGAQSANMPAWRSQVGADTTLRLSTDRALETELGARGLSTQWLFPPSLARSAKRNPTYITDPYAMRASDAVRIAIRRPNEPLIEPFASQLRALAGVSDARYALVPLDVRFEPSVPDEGRVHLRAALVDARASQVIWAGEITTDGARNFSPALLTQLAQRFADLVVPRPT